MQNSYASFCWILFLFLTSPLLAQQSPTPDYAWAHSWYMHENVAYDSATLQRLDIYVHGTWIGEPTYFEEDSLLRPTLVFFHGGGWAYGAKEDFDNEGFFINFLRQGWNVVNVDYRTGEGTAPQAADDAICVLRWIADHAATYHIDPKQLVLCGASAGGHLALLAGLVQNHPGSHPCVGNEPVQIQAIINWFGVTEIERVHAHLTQLDRWNYVEGWVGDTSQIASISQRYSPLHYVRADTPPVITLHGDLDSVVPYPQAQSLHQALEKARVKNELVTLQGGKHQGFTPAQFQLCYERIFAFLAE